MQSDHLQPQVLQRCASPQVSTVVVTPLHRWRQQSMSTIADPSGLPLTGLEKSLPVTAVGQTAAQFLATEPRLSAFGTPVMRTSGPTRSTRNDAQTVVPMYTVIGTRVAAPPSAIRRAGPISNENQSPMSRAAAARAPDAHATRRLRGRL